MKNNALLGHERLEKENAPKLFGVVPLYQISKIYDIDLESLDFLRLLLQAHPYEKRRHYSVTAEVILALGFMADEVVAYEFNIPKALVVELRKHLGIEAKKISRDQAAQKLAEARAEKMRKGRLRRQGINQGMVFQLGDGKTPTKSASRQKNTRKIL
ncbi:hypothetical protein [Pseudomonas mosselii]|uniref:hypothetical protein n=1 Tax=Pseudomonas mosselii TaxID=78327 RepID=UPI0021DA5AC0|nr:hypothetical protein [Pseudomonas mosselii]MCU9528024.1 hypothetical protein [Pseudomonas mosselii]MCU9535133.1 hypothetical protein [Pseudomonas mosselii]MCU9542652.1 hypothetical protein [Pseudomonas mosselii]MCU9546868.1 hypothetical protein [Pseudomonas mosselii]